MGWWGGGEGGRGLMTFITTFSMLLIPPPVVGPHGAVGWASACKCRNTVIHHNPLDILCLGLCVGCHVRTSGSRVFAVPDGSFPQ